MNLRPLLAGGSASYGIQAAGAGAAAYGQYLAGGKTLAEFVEAFVQDVPYIPLCWRKGLAAYSRTMSHITRTHPISITASRAGACPADGEATPLWQYPAGAGV